MAIMESLRVAAIKQGYAYLDRDPDANIPRLMDLADRLDVSNTYVERYADNGPDYSGKCFLCHSAYCDDARQVADLVETRFPKLKGRVEINSIGTTIGSHTGPGMVALFFWGSPQES